MAKNGKETANDRGDNPTIKNTVPMPARFLTRIMENFPDPDQAEEVHRLLVEYGKYLEERYSKIRERELALLTSAPPARR